MMDSTTRGNLQFSLWLDALRLVLTSAAAIFWIGLSIHLLWLLANDNTIVLMSSDALECRTHMMEHKDIPESKQ